MINFSPGKVSVYEFKSGEEVFSFDGCTNISLESPCVNEQPHINLNTSFSMEIKSPTFIKQLLDEICKPLNTIKNKAQFDSILYSKQKRTHKKKRINKKWAKRYGFIDVVGTYEADVEIKEINTSSGETEFELTNLRLINKQIRQM